MRTRPGWSRSLAITGWSSSSPKRRAKATCSARVMSWSRRNRTLCFNSSPLISANRASSRAASPRFTSDSSAPMLQVSSSTLIEVFGTPLRDTAGAVLLLERVCGVMSFIPPPGALASRGDRRVGAHRELANEFVRLRPLAEAGGWVEMTDVADVHEPAAPRLRQLGDAFEAAERIVATRCDDAREEQRL